MNLSTGGVGPPVQKIQTKSLSLVSFRRQSKPHTATRDDLALKGLDFETHVGHVVINWNPDMYLRRFSSIHRYSHLSIASPCF